MRKLLSLIIISLFVMSGLVFASSEWTYENVTILGPRMGPKGQTPPVEVIKVTVGSEDDSIAVGDVMAWFVEAGATDGNALGFAVAKIRRGCSEDVSNYQNEGFGPYAGVMITVATSNDQGGGGGWTNANPLNPASSIGYMAIRGFCDAKVDTSQATVSDHLVVGGHKSTAGGAGPGYFMTLNNITGVSSEKGFSEDIGVLLEDTGTDGLMKVWLR
jgi:hypothetical protein